jgi:dethiobiotin synthetase
MRGLFITGTDTGVGKTFVSAALSRLFRRQGRRVSVCKPVATGALWCDFAWVSEDTQLLAEAAGIAGEWQRVTAWAFPDPVAPSVAARRLGVTLTVEKIAQAVRERHQPGSLLLVEGVGGLLCPLTDHETVAGLAAALGLPLIVVTRRSLGTLNHTLLTLEAARSRALAVAGVIVNQTNSTAGLADESNVDELGRFLDAPLLAVIPYQTCFDEIPPELAAVDWLQLVHGSKTAVDDGRVTSL